MNSIVKKTLFKEINKYTYIVDIAALPPICFYKKYVILGEFYATKIYTTGALAIFLHDLLLFQKFLFNWNC